MNEFINNPQPVEVEKEEKETNWKFIIIFSAVYIAIALGVSFLVSALADDYGYAETISALFGVIALLFMMFRIWSRGSHNVKQDKTVFEDKTTLSYKNWFRMQICLLCNGLVLCLLAGIFFLIFVAQ
jgi:Na+/melibiose symporter-like transporter